MGITVDDLKNPLNKPIILAKVSYIEGTTAKFFWFSDLFINVPSFGAAEARMDSVPFFKKEIDPLTNAVIVQSSYKIDLNNADGYLNNLFEGKIFNNQKVEIYVTTEESSDFLLVATALIQDLTISDKIEINLKEVNDLTKINKLTIWDKTTDLMPEDLVDTKKRVVAGEVIVDGVPVNPIPGDWLETGLNGYIIKMADTNYFRLVLYENEVDFNADEDNTRYERLRKNIFDGDKITIKGYEDRWTFSIASSLYYPDVIYVPGGANWNYINLQLEEGDSNDFYPYTGEEELVPEWNVKGVYRIIGEILTEPDDGVNYEDEYFVGDKQTSTVESTSLVAIKTETITQTFKTDDPGSIFNIHHNVRSYSADANFLQLADDWTWLRAGDILQVLVEQFQDDEWEDLTEEEVEVESYDQNTKKVYFKTPDHLSSFVQKGLSDPLSFRVSVRFDKVQKITVKDKTFSRRKNSFDISIDATKLGMLENYPSQDIDYSANEVNYFPLDGGDWNGFPGVSVRVKKNASQIIANLAQVTRAKVDSRYSGFNNEENMISYYAVGSFGFPYFAGDYGSLPNCRIELVFPDGDTSTDFARPVAPRDFSKYFILIRVKSGTCTLNDLKNLENDPMCPFTFTLEVSGSTVINFDSTINSINTTHSTTYINVSSGDLSKYKANDEVFIRNNAGPGSTGQFAVIKSIDAVNNRLVFRSILTPSGNCVISKRHINNVAEQSTYSPDAIGTQSVSSIVDQGDNVQFTISNTSKFSGARYVILENASGGLRDCVRLISIVGSTVVCVKPKKFSYLNIAKMRFNMLDFPNLFDSIVANSSGTTNLFTVTGKKAFIFPKEEYRAINTKELGRMMLIKDETDGWYYTYFLFVGQIVHAGTTYYVLTTEANLTVPAGTQIEMRWNTDIRSNRPFRTPGFFSTDVSVRTSGFNFENNNNSTDDKTASAFDFERPADKLIRASQERHKIIFTYFMEKNGVASNSAYDSYHNPIKNAKNPLAQAILDFNNAIKSNYDGGANFSGVAQKYATVINMCPFFSLELDSGTNGGGWGGTTVPGFGWADGATLDDKLRAFAHAMAQQINLSLELYFLNPFKDDFYKRKKLPIIAIPVKLENEKWVIRIKHCYFNSCNEVNTELWSKNSVFMPNQSKINYAVYHPYINNNSLLIKVDRKALSMAYNLGVNTDFRLLNLTPYGEDKPDVSTIDMVDYFNIAPSSSVWKDIYIGNGLRRWIVWEGIDPMGENSSFDEVIKKNPAQLTKEFYKRNRGNFFTYTSPNVYTKSIGSKDFESLMDPDAFYVLKTNSPVWPDVNFVVTENIFKTYKFDTPQDKEEASLSEASNQFYCYTPESLNLYTNWDEVGGPFTEKRSFYSSNLTPLSREQRSSFAPAMFEWFDSMDVKVYYRDSQNNLTNILYKILELYNITNYDASSIDALNSLGIRSFMVLDNEQEFYKTIQKFLEANNIVVFVNEAGKIAFKKLDLKPTTEQKTLKYTDFVDVVKKIEIPQYSKILLQYGANDTTKDTGLEQTILNPTKDAIFNLYGVDNVKDITSNIRDEVGATDKEILVQKYTETNTFLEASTGLDQLDLKLNSVVKIVFEDESEARFLVCKIETDFAVIKFKLIKTL